jgi:hypothetical protein
LYSHSCADTLFEVIRESGGYTAWSDKHAAYDSVNGPSGNGVQDLYTPEINSNIASGGVVNGVDLERSDILPVGQYAELRKHFFGLRVRARRHLPCDRFEGISVSGEPWLG